MSGIHTFWQLLIRYRLSARFSRNVVYETDFVARITACRTAIPLGSGRATVRLATRGSWRRPRLLRTRFPVCPNRPTSLFLAAISHFRAICYILNRCPMSLSVGVWLRQRSPGQLDFPSATSPGSVLGIFGQKSPSEPVPCLDPQREISYHTGVFIQASSLSEPTWE